MRFGLGVILVSLFLLANSVFAAAQMEDVNASVNSALIKTIEINATLNKDKFYPGDTLRITGTAKISGGEDSHLNGFVKIIIDDSHSAFLKAGKFSFETTVPSLIKSGDHTVTIEIEDYDANKGSARKQIYVLPSPTALDIYLNNNSFLPGTNIDLSAVLRDQNNAPIDAATMITLYDSKGAERVKTVVHDEHFIFELPSDALPGDWWVYAYSDPLKARRFFKVLEKSEIETHVEGNILVIKNVGNVPYENSVSINFVKNGSSSSKLRKIDLAAGAQTEIELSGSGSYKIDVSSGENKNHFEGISLTGGVVNARVQGDYSSFIFGFIIFVAALIAGSILFRDEKKKGKRR